MSSFPHPHPEMRDGALAAVIRVFHPHDVIAGLREGMLRHRVAVLRMRLGVAVRFHLHFRRAIPEVPGLAAVIAKSADLEGDGIAWLEVRCGSEAWMNRGRNVLLVLPD